MSGNAPDFVIGSIFCLKKIRKPYADMTNPAKNLCYTVFLQRGFGKVLIKGGVQYEKNGNGGAADAGTSGFGLWKKEAAWLCGFLL